MTLQNTSNGDLPVQLGEEGEGRLIVVDSAANDLDLSMSDNYLLSPDDDDDLHDDEEASSANDDIKQQQPSEHSASTAKHSQKHQEPQPQQQQQEEEEGEVRTYSHSDLQALNLLDQPIWIFDIVKRAMWFANTAAVELWSAPDLPTLLARDFSSDMSEATANRLDDYLLKFSSKDATLQDRWTFYPNNGKYGPKTVDCTFKGVMIEEGRLAMLSQGVYIDDNRTDAEEEALRAVEMLRHLPVAVCLTDLQGNVMEQNPEALAVFGSLDANEKAGDQEQKKRPDPNDEEEYDSEDEDNDSGGGSSASHESTFVKRFVDKDLGRRILKEATKEGDENGKNVIRLEALQHTVHGPRWSAIQVRQTKDPVTSKPILLYSARDITAVIEAKRQATAADVAKMDLLADMAHAIRTPLHHVVGVVELISRQGQSKQECQSKTNNNSNPGAVEETKYTNLLQSAAQLLMNVIHDLMGNVGGASGTHFNLGNNSATDFNNNNFGSKPANRIQLEHSQINVKEVVENAIATVAPSLDAKNLTLTVQMTRNSTAALMGDGKRLGQILFEILHNAVKYTSTGGISVKVRRHTKKSRSRRVHLRFEVTDTGVGLNLEQQINCMQLPEKRTSSCRNEQEGQQQEGKSIFDDGVGLILCKSLVEAMGGKMGVESKPGRGATFWFEIPFLRAATGGSSVTKKMPSRQSKRSKKSDRSVGSNSSFGTLSLDPVPDEGGLQILLVDHDNAGRNVMAALLEQSGHSVMTAENGDDMVVAVSQDSYDVVLLETQLPNNKDNMGTALDAVQAIRKMGFSVECLPILALTADVPRGDYPELGLNDWLTKPILLKDIKTAMTNAICNVGARSVGGGSSVCTGESVSICTTEWGTKNGSLAPAPRNSAASVHSAFSDQLQAIMGSSSNQISMDPTKAMPTHASDSALISGSSSTSSHHSVRKQNSDHPPKTSSRRSSLTSTPYT